jgi:hypothetical protein
MPTPPERPTVGDPVAWGNLVKSWAKGTKAVPATLAELLSQCNDADVGMTMPSYVNDLHVVEKKPKSVFVLKLPPKELVEESEKFLKDGGDYVIPQFYNDRYDAELDIPQAQKLNFHAERTGDYTIGLCQ